MLWERSIEDRRRYARTGAGFALVSTLLIVVLVAVIAVSFLLGTGVERVTSAAYGNMARARFSAEAAMESGLAQVALLLAAHPGAVTMWEERHGVVATMLYYKQPGGVTQVHPLLSGGREGAAEAWRGGSLPLELPYPGKPLADDANSVDINLPRNIAGAAGWIGSPAGGPRQAVRVPWVELRGPDGALHGRYAYWIEDNSFKVLLNEAGHGSRGAASPGVEASEVPLEGVLEGVAAKMGYTGGGEGEAAAGLVAQRQASLGGKLWDWSALNDLPPFAGGASLGEELRFYGTLFSEAANLTSAGGRRLDLNALFVPVEEEAEVWMQLGRAEAALRWHLPLFGQRFYRLAADEKNAAVVSSEHQSRYVQKLVVNIRDAMMPQALGPTYLWEEGEEPVAGRPVMGVEPIAGPTWPGVPYATLKGGANSVRAVGKKNLPYLQEWASHTRLHQFDERQTLAEFDFTMHFYFEFWNMSPVDIDTSRGDLGENPFIRIYNLPGFNTDGGTPIPAGRALEIPLENIIFKAGRATVITTAPPDEWNITLLASTPSDSIYSIPLPETGRRFSGETRLSVGQGNNRRHRVNLLARSTADATDYETFVLLGNDAGLLDSVAGLGMARGVASSSNAISLHNDNAATPARNTVSGPNVEQYYVRGNSLHGNRSLSGLGKEAQTGDPRSTNEQLQMKIYERQGDDEQTRYYNNTLDNPSQNESVFNVPGTSSLGWPNTEYVDPGDWPDPFQWSANGVNAPAYYPSGPLRSIGELGHVYDPARGVGPSRNILYSRGGGRTLAIGQPDPLWDGAEGSPSAEWRAWRLTDVFSTTSELMQAGRVNVNGVWRDDGVALSALFSGFEYELGVQGDPGLAGQALAPERLRGIVDAMKAHLQEHGPYFERGAWSEALGGESGAAYDRGREELFRRSVELTTTRGAIFTLYALGEAVRETPSGALVRGATARLKVTFRVLPIWSEALDDRFNPALREDVAARFRPPERYSVEVLQVE